jgi:hypothetical protein
MVQVVAALITLALLAGFALLIVKISRANARRLWLVMFTIVLGSGVAYMDAHSFLAKWAFKGDNPRDGLIALVEGSAARPFVYRRLAPELVGVVTRAALPRLPASALDYLESGSRLARYRGDWTGHESWDRHKAVAFHVAYLLVALSFFGTLLAGAALLQAVRRCSWLEAVVTSSIGMCFVPLMFVGGGYIYDAPELMLWTTLLWVAVRGWWGLSPLLFVLMLANKESAILVLPALAPLLFWQRGWSIERGWRFVAVWLGVLGTIGIAWSLYVRMKYAQNPGGSMEFWLPGNLKFWGNPLHYFMLGPMYSPVLLSPRGANFGLLLIALLPLRFGWNAIRQDMRWAMGIAAGILVPLLITSCYHDEIRNLSLLFPLLFVGVTQGMHELLRAPTASVASAAGE